MFKRFPLDYSDIGPTFSFSGMLFADDGTQNGVISAAEFFALFGIKEVSGTTSLVSNPGQDDNSTNIASTEFAKSLVSGVQTINCAGSADIALTPAQVGKGILVLTGVLTSNINVVAPSLERQWIVCNRTAGNYVVNFKSVGTGVIIKQGSSQQVYCDATNCYYSDSYVSFSQLPVSAQRVPIVASVPGLVPANSYLWLIPITQDVIIPANLAGSIAQAITAATANAMLKLSLVRGGTTSDLATLTFFPGNAVATISSQSDIILRSGDMLVLTTPVTQDTTLANVGISVLVQRV